MRQSDWRRFVLSYLSCSFIQPMSSASNFVGADSGQIGMCLWLIARHRRRFRDWDARKVTYLLVLKDWVCRTTLKPCFLGGIQRHLVVLVIMFTMRNSGVRFFEGIWWNRFEQVLILFLRREICIPKGENHGTDGWDIMRNFVYCPACSYMCVAGEANRFWIEDWFTQLLSCSIAMLRAYTYS